MIKRCEGWNIATVDRDWADRKVLFVVYLAKMLRWLKVHSKFAISGAPQVAMRNASQIWQIFFPSQTFQVFLFSFAKPSDFLFGPSQKGTTCSSVAWPFGYLKHKLWPKESSGVYWGWLGIGMLSEAFFLHFGHVMLWINPIFVIFGLLHTSWVQQLLCKCLGVCWLQWLIITS